ncbi:MAG: response regulator [FCB group bacterium]|nr:response regulator [FCB group bacterium]
MSKKVLLVERSLAVRGIAESLLRQNGYEVLAADGADGALEILHGSKIDLLLIASDINDKNGQRFYESLGADNSTAVIPLIIMHDQTEGELAYPPEAIIGKPFTPSEFLDKVAAFSGSADQPITTEVSPFANADVEDDLIDAALGLDKLDVAESEVIGNDTGVYRVQNKKVTQESMIGFDYKAQNDDSTINRKKIDQVSVPPPKSEKKAEEENSDFLGNDSDRSLERPTEGMSSSSKIEIVPDQYGMIPPAGDKDPSTDGTGSGHDYDWFVNEMQREAASPKAADSGSLPIAPTSEGMEPVAPSPAPIGNATEDVVEKPSHNQAVDKFISEFKKEMEKISDEVAPDIPVTSIVAEQAPAAPEIADMPAEATLNWDDAIEQLGPDGLHDLSRDLIDAVAAKLADRIAARLDPETVYQLLKTCLLESSKKKK